MEPLQADPDMERPSFALHDPTRNSTRPEFIPKLPPRRRQRGALPHSVDQPGASCVRAAAKDQPCQAAEFTSAPATASHEAHFVEDRRNTASLPIDFDMSSRHDVASALHSMDAPSARDGLLPLPRGAMANRQNIPHQPRNLAVGAVHHSWQRVSNQGEQPHSRYIIRPASGHLQANYMRGHISQAHTIPLMGSSPLQRHSSALPSIAQSSGTLSSFLNTKASFEGMWYQLENDIQCREGMLMDMKAEMDKCASLLKRSKCDAVREKEEAEASRADLTDIPTSVNKQIQRLKLVREGLEQVSTDLSVQVAELNLLLQQTQEQQRVFELFESLKEHYDATANENRIQMDKSLQECEVKLCTMEEELERSRIASANLEKTFSKNLCDLEELDAGSVLADIHTTTDLS